MEEPNLTVDNDMVVTVDYVLTLDNGDVVEDTHAGMPMRFLAGHDEILPALEDALFGLAVGDQTAVTLAPDDAYGDYDPEAFEEASVDDVPRQTMVSSRGCRSACRTNRVRCTRPSFPKCGPISSCWTSTTRWPARRCTFRSR